mmetsp:Transcript_62247/g.122446  ORF Transcript_62247/g.122446 Transcript_62247/m.122446 type:complete len:272 (+) Transcript_62247:303-1118(+)
MGRRPPRQQELAAGVHRGHHDPVVPHRRRSRPADDLERRAGRRRRDVPPPPPEHLGGAEHVGQHHVLGLRGLQRRRPTTVRRKGDKLGHSGQAGRPGLAALAPRLLGHRERHGGGDAGIGDPGASQGGQELGEGGRRHLPFGAATPGTAPQQRALPLQHPPSPPPALDRRRFRAHSDERPFLRRARCEGRADGQAGDLGVREVVGLQCQLDGQGATAHVLRIFIGVQQRYGHLRYSDQGDGEPDPRLPRHDDEVLHAVRHGSVGEPDLGLR